MTAIRTLGRVALVWAAFVGARGITISAEPPRYVLDLLPIADGCQSFSTFRGLRHGRAVGSVTCDDFATSQAVVWDADGWHALGTFGGPSSSANAIDARGRVVGFAETPDRFGSDYYVARPFVYDAGTLTDLGTLGGMLGVALDISSDGTIVGACEETSDPASGAMKSRACVWDRDGVRDVGTLGGDWAAAYAINARGTIVGSSLTNVPLPSGECCEERAFQFEHGAMTALPGLGGWYTVALSISERGTIVGYAGLPSGPAGPSWHATLWEGGRVHDLGTLGGPFSAAMDVNPEGTVVGWAFPARPSGRRGAVWVDGIIADLNDRLLDGDGWIIDAATSIDERGVILANAIRNGVQRVVLLTPVRNAVAIDPTQTASASR